VSVSQEDRIAVLDPANLDAAPSYVAIPGRMPRALARNAAGTLVYAAVFHAGNRTTSMSEVDVPNDSLPVDPVYPRNPAIPTPRPQTGLIVQQDAAGNWNDMYGK